MAPCLHLQPVSAAAGEKRRQKSAGGAAWWAAAQGRAAPFSSGHQDIRVGEPYDHVMKIDSSLMRCKGSFGFTGA